MAYVYAWTNSVNGKQYVGKGTGGRCHEHFIKPGRSGALHRAALKYGREAFVLEIVADDLDDAAAYALERQEIARRGSLAPGGYNLTAGGEGLLGPSVTTRRKLADAARGNRRGCFPKSSEVRAKISAAHKGKTVDPEHMRKLQEGAARRLKEHGANGKGIVRGPRSPESVEKQRQSMLATMARKRAEREVQRSV